MKRPVSVAREVALKILQEVEKEGSFANHLLEGYFERTGMVQKDRRLTYLLVYGILRHRNRLDWAISEHSDHPIEKLTPWIRNCLRMGAFQLLDMPDLRPSVAVDESVRLAHRYGHRGTASLVNALLRKLASVGHGHIPDMAEDPEAHLVIAQSHPGWLVRRWLKRYGPEIALKLCTANNLHPPLTIRWNPIKGGNPEQALADLENALERPVRSEILPEGFIIQGPRPIIHHALYKEGKIDLQGLSSMLMTHLLDLKAGQRVLDACAGSGGKACHMAALMDNQGEIICIDHRATKLKALDQRAKHLGVKICRPVCAGSDQETPWKAGSFDRVLVDAPCSSLGIIQRHPEIRWLRKEEDLSELARIQGDILKQAAKALRKGGRLLYCTCSLEPEETENIMRGFLEEHPDFRTVDIRGDIPRPLKNMVNMDGALRLFPFVFGVDGFFAFSVTKYKDSI
ncbi:MAG: 16S rRNA (cytosine(967)-C(5))-methyltransferase RsmB [bacterium]